MFADRVDCVTQLFVTDCDGVPISIAGACARASVDTCFVPSLNHTYNGNCNKDIQDAANYIAKTSKDARNALSKYVLCVQACRATGTPQVH